MFASVAQVVAATMIHSQEELLRPDFRVALVEYIEDDNSIASVWSCATR